MKKRKCGFCKQKFTKLAECWVFKVDTHWQEKKHTLISKLNCVYLCDICKILEYDKNVIEPWDLDLLNKSWYLPYKILDIENDKCWVKIIHTQKPVILKENYFKEGRK